MKAPSPPPSKRHFNSIYKSYPIRKLQMLVLRSANSLYRWETPKTLSSFLFHFLCHLERISIISIPWSFFYLCPYFLIFCLFPRSCVSRAKTKARCCIFHPFNPHRQWSDVVSGSQAQKNAQRVRGCFVHDTGYQTSEPLQQCRKVRGHCPLSVWGPMMVCLVRMQYWWTQGWSVWRRPRQISHAVISCGCDEVWLRPDNFAPIFYYWYCRAFQRVSDWMPSCVV